MLGKRPSSDDGTSDTSNNARSYPRKRVSIAYADCARQDAMLRNHLAPFALTSTLDSTRPDTKNEELLQALKRLDRIEQALDAISQKVGVISVPHFQDLQSWQSPAMMSASLQLDMAPSQVSVNAAKPNNRQYYACKMPTLLNFRHPLPERTDWSWDLSEHFFAGQIEEMIEVRNCVNNASLNPDFSDIYLWSLQQRFEEHVLKWFPISDSSVIMQHIQYARSVGYHDGSAASCLSLLVFANGCIAGEKALYSATVKNIPGFGYYARAISILEKHSTASDDVTILQCQLLAGMYLHHACRPLEAWRYINQTAQDCILRLRSERQKNHTDQGESFNRLYWICYIMESELEACLELASSGIREYASEVPLPISRYEEEGMYFLLALVSLRKVMVEVLDTVGFSSRAGYVSYNPAVALELKTQIDEWFNHLPTTLKFSLDGSRVHDPRKAYLRLAYLAVVIVATWPFLIPLAKPPFNTADPLPQVSPLRPPGPTSHPSQDYISIQPPSYFYHHHHYYQSPTPSSRHTPTPMSTTSPYPSNSPILANDHPPAHRAAAQTCIDSCRAYLSYAEEAMSIKSLVSHLIVRQYFAFTMILILSFNNADEQSPGSVEEKMFLQTAMSNLKVWGVVPFVKVCLNEMRRVGRSRGFEGGL